MSRLHDNRPLFARMGKSTHIRLGMSLLGASDVYEPTCPVLQGKPVSVPFIRFYPNVQVGTVHDVNGDERRVVLSCGDLDLTVQFAPTW